MELLELSERAFAGVKFHRQHQEADQYRSNVGQDADLHDDRRSEKAAHDGHGRRGNAVAEKIAPRKSMRISTSIKNLWLNILLRSIKIR